MAGVALLTVAVAAPAAPGLRVKGNRLVAGSTTVRLIGVNRSGSEYACSGPDGAGGNGWDIWQGPVGDRAIEAMRTWRINAVALPLNEACWLGGYAHLKRAFSGERYRRAVEGYVTRLQAHGMYVVLRLSGAAPGDHAYGSAPMVSSEEIPMADAAHSPAFWRSVAARFRTNRRVAFHLFDEPHDIPWACALHGCTANDRPEGRVRFGSYRAVGHQALVNAIRSKGAHQPIVVSGIDFAGELGRWEAFRPKDPEHQLVVGFNTFDYSGNYQGAKGDLRRLARLHPILVGGFGDTDCNSDFSRGLMRFADSIHISYLAWTWNTVQDYGGCSNALLDGGPGAGPNAAYYSARPSGYGAGVRKHLRDVNAGARYP